MPSTRRSRSAFRPVLLALAALALRPAVSSAFCGFYVSSGDAKLFNHSSQVVLVRDEDRTVLTMASDYRGAARDFALVVPVPTVLKREQIRIADRAAIDHLDAFSAPRLVEYFDADPCAIREEKELDAVKTRGAVNAPTAARALKAGHGVTIEARYTVGEYDILILSAKQSTGLATWLAEHHYKVPHGAARVMRAYLRQGMKFFVAKVNLREQARLGYASLRPLRIAYASPRFMLPVRLGMANADGAQELFVYAITKVGRVEPVNYRGVKLPTGQEVPGFVQQDFPRFYRSLFAHQTDREGGGVVFTEYAWDMSWCDPCAAPPLSPDELATLGADWAARGGGGNVFLTRLHARYDRATFPEDLVLQVTADRENYQGRYVIRHEWQGASDCAGAVAYRRALPERRARQAETLAELTGWPLAEIRARMAANGTPAGAVTGRGLLGFVRGIR